MLLLVNCLLVYIYIIHVFLNINLSFILFHSCGSSDSDDSNSPNEEEGDPSLPRQSVMRRPEPPPPSSSLPSPSSNSSHSPTPQITADNRQLLFSKKNHESDDYQPTSEEEEEEEERQSSSSSSSSEKGKKKKDTKKKRAKFNSSSDDSGKTSNSSASMHVKMDVKKFYKPRKELMISTNCFYKTDTLTPMANDMGLYQRRAARNVRYKMDSESEGEDEKHSKKGRFYGEHTRDSDSDFQVSSYMDIIVHVCMPMCNFFC